MKYKHDENEKFALEYGDIAVPIELYDDSAIVYHVAESAFLLWNTEFGTAPFSGSSKNRLINELVPIMKKYNFHPSEDIGKTLLIYIFNNHDAPTLEESNIVILKTPQEIENCKFDPSLPNFDLVSGNYGDVVCCCLREDKAVAFSALNDYSDNEYPEIYVECAPKYRMSGYATLCVKAMARYLTTVCNAKKVSYVCESSNAASCRVAEKAGFKLIGHRIPFVFYRNKNNFEGEEAIDGV